MPFAVIITDSSGRSKVSLLLRMFYVNTDLTNVEEFKDMVITMMAHNLIRLRDIGTVELGAAATGKPVAS